ncbi:MAG: glycosyltransferase [Paludibacteraceae bacterium]|nr:glycosyltransferase [Paludibacteraceae bacterium]
MISILVPIYNFDSRELIKEIHRQCEEADIDYDILVADDASTECLDAINEISGYPYITFFRYDENQGRSAIRNDLAVHAKHNFLLFIDCDAQIRSNDYIKNYLPYLKDNVCVFGGIALYPDPLSDDYSIERMYNAKVETKYVKNHVFTSFNFLIDRNLFLAYMFDDKICGYGHEDTMLAYRVSETTKIEYIDNPLVHLGISKNDAYLNKVKESCANMLKLEGLYSYKDAMSGMRLWNSYTMVKRLKMKDLLRTVLYFIYPHILKKVMSRCSSLFSLDLLKLYYILNSEK